MSSVKETEFFNTFTDRSTAWYESHFKHEARAIGEISSNYYLDADVAGRILKYDPSMRIIINLRDPYTLLQSFYNFGCRRGVELDPIENSMDVPVGILMGSGFKSRQKKGTLTVSDQTTLLDAVCLYDRLKPFLDSFPAQQVHFFVFERLQSDWQGALHDVYSFLDVDPKFMPPEASQIVNSSVEPKSVLVARLATSAASVLRSVGLYRVLSMLHSSERLKQILFKANKQDSAANNVRAQLDDAIVRQLDDQINLLLAMHGSLANHWQPA